MKFLSIIPNLKNTLYEKSKSSKKNKKKIGKRKKISINIFPIN